jgi:hypothetical protein
VPDNSTEAPSEREKWEAECQFKKDELAVKKRELEIRELESHRARWTNPLVIAVLSAAVAGIGNVAATLYSSQQQREADERKAAEARTLESEKAEASLILEVVKTQTPEKAADNLKFLVDTKLIINKSRREDISAYIKSRREGQGVNIPPPSVTLSGNTARKCIVKGENVRAVTQVIDKVSKASLREAIERPWFFSDDSKSGVKKLLFSGGPHGYEMSFVLWQDNEDTDAFISADVPYVNLDQFVARLFDELPGKVNCQFR